MTATQVGSWGLLCQRPLAHLWQMIPLTFCEVLVLEVPVTLVGASFLLASARKDASRSRRPLALGSASNYHGPLRSKNYRLGSDSGMWDFGCSCAALSWHGLHIMIRFRCGLGALTHLMAMRLRLASTRPFHDRLLTVNLGKSYRLQLIHATGLPVGAGRSRALL